MQDLDHGGHSSIHLAPLGDILLCNQFSPFHAYSIIWLCYKNWGWSFSMPVILLSNVYASDLAFG